jgi:hypothetical protein
MSDDISGFEDVKENFYKRHSLISVLFTRVQKGRPKKISCCIAKPSSCVKRVNGGKTSHFGGEEAKLFSVVQHLGLAYRVLYMLATSLFY